MLLYYQINYFQAYNHKISQHTCSKKKIKKKKKMASNSSSQSTIFFWRETSRYGYMSQWYVNYYKKLTSPPSPLMSGKFTIHTNLINHLRYYCPFTSDPTEAAAAGKKPIIFKTAEHYMMYSKALLFSPSHCAAILSAKHPRDVKNLGREIPNFDEKVWNRHRNDIVRKGNYLKFTYPVRTDEDSTWYFEGKTLRESLLETGDRELVEASPYDRIWGVGFKPENAEKNRRNWGLNLLGKALVDTRAMIREEEEEEERKREEGKPEEEA